MRRKPQKPGDTIKDQDVSGTERPDSKANYRLEALEPRILLSGDPILGELARTVMEDGSDNSIEEAAIVHQVDTVAEAEAVIQQDSNQAVAWPENWGETTDTTADDDGSQLQPESGSAGSAIPADGADATESAPAEQAKGVAGTLLIPLDDLTDFSSNDFFGSGALPELTGSEWQDPQIESTNPVNAAEISTGSQSDSGSETAAGSTSIDRTGNEIEADSGVDSYALSADNLAESDSMIAAEPRVFLVNSEAGQGRIGSGFADSMPRQIGVIITGLRLQSEQRAARNQSLNPLNITNSSELPGIPTGRAETLFVSETVATSLARGPPITEEIQLVNENTAAEIFQAGRFASYYISADDGYFAAETSQFTGSNADMPRAPPGEDSLARAPPVGIDNSTRIGSAVDSVSVESLTQSQLATVFETAIRAWSDYLEATGLSSEALGSLNFQIVDLADDVLGYAEGNTIYLDADAAGKGWFVDSTPGDHSEFTVDDSGRLLAKRNGDAFGNVDLLTVLTHEVGHALGFDHDSGLAVMSETVAAGLRAVLPSSDFAIASQPGADSITAAANQDGSILTLGDELADVTVTLVDAGGDASLADFIVNGVTYFDVTEIVGSTTVTVTLESLLLENVWDLTGINSGTLTAGGLDSVIFSDVQRLEGGASADTFGFYGGLTFGGLSGGAGRLTILIGDFVGITGFFDFTSGTATVDINTGLSGNFTDLSSSITSLLPASFTTLLGGLTDLSQIPDVAVNTQSFSATGVSIFVGINRPDDLASFDPNNPGAAVGLYATGVDVGFVRMKSQISIGGSYAVFNALKANVGLGTLVGVPGITATVTNLEINFNNGSWPRSIAIIPGMPAPSIDFISSFGATGYAIPGSTPSIFIDYTGRITAASAANITIDLGGFVYISGSFAFEMGGLERVTVVTGLGDNLTAIIDAVDGIAPGTPLADATAALTAGASAAGLTLGPGLSTIGGLEVSTIRIGIGDAEAFLGLNGPLSTNPEAIGLSMQHVDFGLVLMAPTLGNLPGFSSFPPTFFALRAHVSLATLVGLEGVVTATVEDVDIDINAGAWSGLSILGNPFLPAPVVDFAASFPEELLAFDTNGNGELDSADVGLPAALLAADTAATGNNDGTITIEELLALYDDSVTSATGDGDGLLEISDDAALAAFAIYDTDGDGALDLDPTGMQIATGPSSSLVIDFSTEIFRGAAGYVNLDVGRVQLAGSMAFVKGPTKLVTLSDTTQVNVVTMTIGADEVFGFYGLGTYWQDSNDDNRITSADTTGSGIGIAIENLSVALAVFASTDITRPAGFVALDLQAPSIELVGVPGVEASGSIDIQLNLGFAFDVAGFNFALPVVNFAATYPDELLALTIDTGSDGVPDSGVFDTDGDGDIDSADASWADLGAADGAGVDGVVDNEVTRAELIAFFDSSGNGELDNADAAWSSIFAAADVDVDGKIDVVGLEVETGNDPIYLSFSALLIDAEVIGRISALGLLEFDGSFLLQVSDTQFTIGADADLLIGGAIPGVDFGMHATGVFVLNNLGIAGDINITMAATVPGLTIGPATGAHLVFNTTDVLQTVTLPSSTVVPISAGAPNLDGTFGPDGDYVVVTFDATVGVLGVIDLVGSFRIAVSTTGFELSIDATLDMALAGTNIFEFDVAGALQITSAGKLIAAIEVTQRAGSGLPPALGFDFGATTTFRIDINTSGAPVDPDGTTGPIGLIPIGFRLHVDGAIDLPGISLEGIFDLQVTATSFSAVVVADTSIIGLSFNVTGGLFLFDDGLVAALTLTSSAATPGVLGFDFGASTTFNLTLNTTPGALDPDGTTGPIAEIPFGLFLNITGDLVLPGITINGTFDVTITATELSVVVTADTSIIGLSFNVTGGLFLFDDGLVAALTLTSSAATPGVLGFDFGASTTFNLTLNTTPGALDPDGTTGPIAEIPFGLFLNITGDLVLPGITINGTFDVTITATELSVVVTASTSIIGLSFNVTGGLFLFDDGLVAALTLTSSAATPGVLGFDFGASTTFNLTLNTTPGALDPDGTTGPIAEIPFGLFLNITGDLVLPGITINGTFDVTITATELSVVVTASTSIIGLSFNVTGGLFLFDDGLVAALTLTSSAATPGVLGFDFGASTTFNLTLNTTPGALDPDGTTGPIAEIPFGLFLNITGDLVLPGITINGTFDVTITATELSVVVTADTSIIGLSFNVTGGLFLFDDGLVAALTLTSSAATPGVLGFDFGASTTFNLTLNTTPGALDPDGTTGPIAEIPFGLFLNITGDLVLPGITINGTFDVTITATELSVVVTASTSIIGLSFNVTGGLFLFDDGLVAALTLTSSAATPGVLGFDFGASTTFNLTLNTTPGALDPDGTTGPIAEIPFGLFLNITGDLVLPGITINGTFDVTITATELSVVVTASTSIIGLSFNVTGGLFLFDDGLVAALTLTSSAATPGVLGFDFGASTTFNLTLNTTPGALDPDGTTGPIAEIPFGLFLNITGDLVLPGITINGTFDVTITATELSVVVTASTSIIGLSFNVTGGLFLFDDGLVAALTLTSSAATPGVLGFDFGASTTFNLTLNTTPGALDPDGTTGPIAEIPFGLFLNITGDLVLPGITINGTFDVTITATELSVVVTASTSIIGLSFNVTGGLFLFDDGLVAALTLTSSAATPGVLGFDFGASTTFNLTLNTTPGALDPDGTTGPIAEIPFGLFLNITGDLVLPGITINGTFDVTITATELSVVVTASTSIIGLSFNVTGGLFLFDDGLVAALTLTSSAATPGVLGFDFGASTTFNLTLNTTPGALDPDGTTGPIAEIPFGLFLNITGDLVLPGITINGTFDVTITATELSVVVTADTSIIGLSFNVTGGLFLFDDGLVAALTLTSSAATPGVLGFDFGASTTFNLTLNTTPGALDPDGTTGPIAEIPFGLFLNITGDLVLPGITINGTFDVTITATELSVVVTASTSIIGLSFNVTGGLFLFDDGLVAALTLTLTGGGSTGLGFSFTGTFSLTLNTTSGALDPDGAGTAVTTPVPVGFFLHVNGSMVLGGFLTLAGTFDIQITGTKFAVAVFATTSVFGSPPLTVNGSAEIYFGSTAATRGLVLDLQLKLGTNPNVVVEPAAGFNISGIFHLRINTTDGTKTSLAGHSIFKKTYEIEIGASVNFFGFVASGTLIVKISSTGLFSIHVPTSSPLTISFFGAATIELSGDLFSDGRFSFTAKASFLVGDMSSFGASGSIDVTISNSGFSATVTGKVVAFGVTLAKATGHISYASGLVVLRVDIFVTLFPAVNINIDMPWPIPDIHINTDAVVIDATAEFVLGSTTTAAEPPPPPIPPILGSAANGGIFAGGLLYLNLGVDVANRHTNVNYPSVVNENFIVTLVGPGTDFGQKIKVSALGFDVIYDNVTGIVVRDTQGLNTRIEIGSAITVPVDINWSGSPSGNNFFTTGGGFTRINGGTGSNNINFGTGGGIYQVGDGDNTFHDVSNLSGSGLEIRAPGFSNYQLSDEVLSYHDGDPGHVNNIAFTGSDVSRVRLNGAANATYAMSFQPQGINNNGAWTGEAWFNGAGTGSTVQAIADVYVTLSDSLLSSSAPGTGFAHLSNIRNAELAGANTDAPGNDESNVFDISGWTGNGQIGRAAALGSEFGVDMIIATNDADFWVSDSSLTRSSGGTMLLNGVRIVHLTGGPSVNHFTVSNWLGTAILDGAANDDVYTVNLRGSGGGITSINDSGGADDRVTINGTAANDTFAIGPTTDPFILNPTRVTRAGEVVIFGTAIELLTVNGNNAIDTFNVADISVVTVLNGNDGDDVFNITDTHAALTINGGANDDRITIHNIHAAAVVNGNDHADTMTVNATSADITMNGGTGGDTFNVKTLGAGTTATINTGADSSANVINFDSNGTSSGGDVDGIDANVVVHAQSSNDTVNVHDNDDVFNAMWLTTNTLTGLGMAVGITFDNVEFMVINLGARSDEVNVRSTYTNTRTTINVGNTNGNTVNVGADGTVDSVDGYLEINGQSGSDLLNVIDTGDSSNNTGVLSSNRLTGLDMGAGVNDLTRGIEYNGITLLQINLGSGDDNFTVLSTHTGTTNLEARAGQDTINIRTISGFTRVFGDGSSSGDYDDVINVGSNAGIGGLNTGGVLDGIQGTLQIEGSGQTVGDQLNIDDSGDADSETGTLTNQLLTGLGMNPFGSIMYTGIEALDLKLGMGHDELHVASTHTGTTQVSAGPGNDQITVASIAGSTVLNGDGNDDTFTIDTTSANLIINGGTGGDTANIRAVGATTITTINTGADGTANTVNVGSTAPGTDGDVNAISGELIINGQSANDTVNVYDMDGPAAHVGQLTLDRITGLGMTGAGISYNGVDFLNINLGARPDTFNILSTYQDTTTTLDTGAGNDTINIGSLAPAVNGDVDAIDGYLIINGGADNDTLNVDDAGDSGTNIGVLSSNRLTGLDMGAGTNDVTRGIEYGTVETLNINLGGGNDDFLITSTHAGATNLEARAGQDTINIRTISGTTTVNGDGSASGNFDDVINVGSQAEESVGAIGRNFEGTLNGIQAALIIEGGGQMDVDRLNVDDSGDSLGGIGTLTDQMITGLGMHASGITYTGIEALHVTMGYGNDQFHVASTHAGTTRISGGPGNDQISVDTIAGATEIEGDDPVIPIPETFNITSKDYVRVTRILDNQAAVTLTLDGTALVQGIDFNYDNGSKVITFSAPLTGEVVVSYTGNPAIFARAGPTATTFDDLIRVNVDATQTPTTSNGIGALLSIDGQQGSDDVVVYLAGEANAADPISIIDAFDTGTVGKDTLSIYGSDSTDAGDEDRFLLRQNFVALIPEVTSGETETAERVNYTGYLDDVLAVPFAAGLFVFGQGGDDYFALDDNSAETQIDGGAGNDMFQVGQMFQSLRELPHVPYLEDTFATVETTRGYLSNGNSYETTILGSDGNDEFVVFHNTAELVLDGGDHDDTFTVRGFALSTSVAIDPNQQVTDIVGGLGADDVQYTANAPVNIDGGAGNDSVIIVGTEFSDTITIDNDRIIGAGVTVFFDHVESLEIDGLEGNDTFYILATNAGVTVTVYGGLGSDVFNVGRDGLLNEILGTLRIEGGIDPDADRGLPTPLLYIGESNPDDFVPPDNVNFLAIEAEHTDILNVFNHNHAAGGAGVLTDTRFTGFGMGADIEYANLEMLRIDLGLGADDLTVDNTHAGRTTINSGPGNDNINILTIGGATQVNTEGGNDVVNVGTAAPLGGGTIDQISAFLMLNTGAGDDQVNLDDSGDTNDNVYTLTGDTFDDADLAGAFVQTISLEHASGGSFVIQIGALSTTALEYDSSAEEVEAALVALGLADVNDILVNRAANVFTIAFVGDEVLSGAGLTMTSSPLGLVTDGSGTPAIVITPWSNNVTQTIVLNAIAGTHTVTVGADLATFNITVGDSANTVRDALIDAIRLADPSLESAEGHAVGIKDVIVEQVGDTYFIGYQGLLRGTVGSQFELSVEATTTLVQNGTAGLTVNAVGGTFTLLHNGDRTYEMPWNVTATALQDALNSMPGTLGVTVALVGNTYMISGLVGTLTVNDLSLDNPIVASLRMSGINYYNVDNLNIQMSAGDDVVNVQGTTAVTNIFGNGGDERFYVSSLANEDLLSATTTDFLEGDLDDVLGELNIDAGAGRHILMISDESSLVGDANVVITDLPTTGLPGAEIQISDLAPGTITFQADVSGNFADGITIWTGYGNDTITVDGSHVRTDLRTITTLNTGLGDDFVTVDLDTGEDGFFVLNTQGPYDDYLGLSDNDTVRGAASSLPLIIFGGQGSDDFEGGSGADTIFGDRGRVVYLDDLGDPATVLGNGGPGDRTDGVERNPNTIFTVDPTIGDDDTINGNGNNDILIGGTLDDTIMAGAGNDLVFGDHASVEATPGNEIDASDLPLSPPNVSFEFTSIYEHNDYDGGDDIIFGEAGDDIILGQQGDDRIYGGDDDDDIIGGHNVAGGHDGNDRIDGGAGNDVITGDNASILRNGDSVSPLVRELGDTVIYDLNGNANVTGASQTDPTGNESRTIVILDHSDTPAPNTHGDDYIAGGADNDMIFGQLGNDTIQGDGSVVLDPLPGDDVFANRDPLTNLLDVNASVESSTDGDDYIEGGGDNDTIFGNLGQDDIIGGSSDLFGLVNETDRPDGSDFLFGGAGTDIARNDLGDATVVGSDIVVNMNGHSEDSDMILGDNGRIFRLVDATTGDFLEFNYDQDSSHETRGGERIIVRAAELLDYTPGGPDFDATAEAMDNGAADEIHGESGDDFIYGQVGNDILFGEGQDDDLIGGWGTDWMSGGTGSDGMLGDDGRIYTSRNEALVRNDPQPYSEPLYGILNVDEVDQVINTPGDIQSALINIDGELIKTVNLTPFNVDGVNGLQDNLFDPDFADDVMFGGWGNDFMHGGSGDDAMSGAEALPEYYDNPFNPGDLLGYGMNRAGEFAAYDEFNPLRHILVNEFGEHTTLADDPDAVEFILNFLADDPAGILGEVGPLVYSDGNDRMFGDLGNDWIVGGTGNDRMYGGRGDDLLNGDDDHETNGGENDTTDTAASYEDLAFGGAGRDILIANTGGDRLIDWAGEFNTYLVPFAPFGAFTISRALPPHLFQFLYDLSAADGADPTRFQDTGSGEERNGEPEGELGLVTQHDIDWSDQTGAPADVQPGNIPGGARDVLRGEDFNSNGGTNGTNSNGELTGFAADSGSWEITDGRLEVAPEQLGGDAVSLFFVDDLLPSYFEMRATINAGKPTGGLKSNAYFIFDYQSPTDFKFAGVDISTDKIVIGHRTAEGWIVDVQTPVQLKPNKDYQLLLSINGTSATLVVDNQEVFTFVFAARVDAYGYSYGLNAGMVGFGAFNSVARIDNVAVQILPPEITLEETEDFDDGNADRFDPDTLGNWQITGNAYEGVPATGSNIATSTIDLAIGANYLLELQTNVSTNGIAGFIFDQYSPDDFKFVAISSVTNEVLIGHSTRHGIEIDASFTLNNNAGPDYDLLITLVGTTVSVEVDGFVVLGYSFNAPVTDGAFGLLAMDGTATFDNTTLRTDDPAHLPAESGGATGSSKLTFTNAPIATTDTSVQTESIVSQEFVPGDIQLTGARSVFQLLRMDVMETTSSWSASDYQILHHGGFITPASFTPSFSVPNAAGSVSVENGGSEISPQASISVQSVMTLADGWASQGHYKVNLHWLSGIDSFAGSEMNVSSVTELRVQDKGPELIDELALRFDFSRFDTAMKKSPRHPLR